MRIRKPYFTTCMTFGALVIAHAAQAQSAAENAAAQPVEEQGAGEQGAGEQTDSTGIADIVVTAQKRSENLQRSPTAITAIGAATLVSNGVSDITAAQRLIPSVRLQQQSASTEIYIRGVGSTLDFANIEPPTGFNFNGVYIPREGTSVPLFDMDRLEVLPGPQGTLYGRSALGGIVNAFFVRPSDETDGRVLLEGGTYGLGHVSVAQNFRVTDTLNMRVALDYTRRDAYFTSGADTRKDFAARVSALYKPNSDLSIYVWGYGVTKGGAPQGVVNKGYNAETGQVDGKSFLHKNPWNDTLPASLPAGNMVFGQPKAEKQHYENYVVGAQIDAKLGNDLTLSYIPSYFYLNFYEDYWLGALPSFISAHYNQVTQELRLSGESSRVKWLAGLYGYRVVNDGDIAIRPLAFYLSSVDRNRLQGIAAFGQLTYSLTDALRLTVGGRYSIDSRTGRGFSNNALGVRDVPYDFDGTFKHFDWRIGAEYDVTSRSMVYANVQTGYQPGTYNQRPNSPGFDNLVASAKLTSFAVGTKNRLFDNTLQINNEFFFYKYDDLLIQSFDAGSNFNRIFNAKRVDVYGNQLDVIFKPTDNDQFNASVGYLHTEIKDFPVVPAIEGLTLQNAPKWTISGGYQHDFQLSSGAYVRARVDNHYESSFYGDFAHTPSLRQKAYNKTDATLTYYSEGETWSLGAWIKNIQDKAVQAAGSPSGPVNPAPAIVYLQEPRTYGLRATIKY